MLALTLRFGSVLIKETKSSKFELQGSKFEVSFNLSQTSNFLFHFLCVKFISFNLSFLHDMREVSLAMYLSNVMIFILMLYLSLVYPSLLNNHYWDYLLIGFFTAIVFHTGHEAGKS